MGGISISLKVSTFKLIGFHQSRLRSDNSKITFGQLVLFSVMLVEFISLIGGGSEKIDSSDCKKSESQKSQITINVDIERRRIPAKNDHFTIIQEIYLASSLDLLSSVFLPHTV